MLIFHLQKPGSLVVPCLFPKVYEDVGVQTKHDDQRDHKYDQEDSSEISFLQAFGPSTEVADALFPNNSFTKGVVNDLFQGYLKDEKAWKRRD